MFSGWCYNRIIPKADRTTNIVAYLLGYGLWFAITIIALVGIYSTMLCYLKFRVSAVHYVSLPVAYILLTTPTERPESAEPEEH